MDMFIIRMLTRNYVLQLVCSDWLDRTFQARDFPHTSCTWHIGRSTLSFLLLFTLGNTE